MSDGLHRHIPSVINYCSDCNITWCNALPTLRVGRQDERAPPPPVCELCHRRFCQCVDKPPSLPPYPGAEDCCQSAPQCTFCVWGVYDQQLAEYEAHVSSNPGGGGGGGGSGGSGGGA